MSQQENNINSTPEWIKKLGQYFIQEVTFENPHTKIIEKQYLTNKLDKNGNFIVEKEIIYPTNIKNQKKNK